VADVLLQEEERFGETLEHGMAILEQALAGGITTLDGDTAFKLYDTFGFPLDLTADVCRERNVTVDEAGFDVAMQRQREQARAAGKFRAGGLVEYDGAVTRFVGYDSLAGDAASPRCMSAARRSTALGAGQDAVVVLDTTPFYAESGGQVGDAGELASVDGAAALSRCSTPRRSRPTCSAIMGVWSAARSSRRHRAGAASTCAVRASTCAITRPPT
jgi:alanyl-tRNA synthetase